ncbi:NRPS-like enzyme [Aspergillus terreus]|uniref:NRPS-like enzyme n=1 Tax=Aspergillus terreus TaxID=33178 RepID=A0A5M3Z903_ASPTE|nr:hypothetical protein ATETN484_0011027500 [Aspergillus terreus]GFF18912.1 NRPS-like enzyme [Aspergillus terreus]
MTLVLLPFEPCHCSRDVSQKWSYADVHREVERLSSTLKSLKLPTEAPIGIIEELRSPIVIAQLAVIRASLTCLPLDPSLPIARLRDLLTEVGSRYVLSNKDCFDEVLGVEVIPITRKRLERGYPIKVSSQSNGIGQGHQDKKRGYRSHILYTSGSSGKPKAVQIPEIGILNLASDPPILLQKSDRVAVINNPGFDVSLYEILVPLVVGATIVIVPRPVITDLFNAREFIAEKKISIVFLTASLFNIIAQACPTTFRGVRHVLTAGEAANMAAMTAVLESSGAPKNLWNTYGPTETLVFSTLHPVTPSELQYCNISIGKPFGDTKLLLVDSESNPITEPGKTGEILLGDGTRYYKTGDLAQWRPDNPDLLEFAGRVDLQVKQGGFRVELNEIEQNLLASKALSAAIVVQVRPSDDSDPFLVGYVIPAVSNSVRKRQLVGHMEKRVPDYMVPRDFLFCSKFPITEHGKVDRKGLKDRYLQHQEQSRTDGNVNGKSLDLAAQIRNIWSSLLNISEIKDSDDFFSLRGTSIQAGFDDFDDSETARQDYLHAPVPDWQAPGEGRVFMTGATGFIGAHFLNRLLQMDTVREIICLVRPKNGMSARERVQSVLERYDLWDTSKNAIAKMTVLHGDITKGQFGLTDEQFAWLPYDAHQEVNVIGTKNTLEVAARGRRKTFHYMSSIDTWGTTGLTLETRRLLEDEPLEPHLPSLRYDTGYAASKWVAEAVVRRARQRGIPTIIYRPGFVIGDSRYGHGNPDDFFARLMAGYPVELVPYWEWVHRLEKTDAQNTLMPLMPLLREPVLGGLSRFETSRNTPHYTSFDTVKALEEAPDIRYIPLDAGMLNRFLQFWDRKGYYHVLRKDSEPTERKVER